MNPEPAHLRDRGDRVAGADLPVPAEGHAVDVCAEVRCGGGSAQNLKRVTPRIEIRTATGENAVSTPYNSSSLKLLRKSDMILHTCTTDFANTKLAMGGSGSRR